MRLWLHIVILICFWGLFTILRANYTTPWTIPWHIGTLATAITMVWVGYILGRHDLLWQRREDERHGRTRNQ